MPYEVRHREGYVLARLFGVISEQDIQSMIVESRRLAQLPESNRVVDMSDVDRFDIGFEHMLALSQQRQPARASRPLKSALIAHRPVQIGFARMSQLLNDDPLVESKIVTDLGEALEWFDLGRTSAAPSIQGREDDPRRL